MRIRPESDSSATSIGLRDTAADVARLTFAVGDGSFAVGGPGAAAVPEPSGSTLVAASAPDLA